MSYEEFKSSESYRRMYIKVLDPYESKVYSWLDEHPDLSASQIHDWLRERYQDLPDVNAKTVYNYVKYIRAKYDIEKPPLSSSLRARSSLTSIHSTAVCGSFLTSIVTGRIRKHKMGDLQQV
jgi:hypothetical protein